MTAAGSPAVMKCTLFSEFLLPCRLCVPVAAFMQCNLLRFANSRRWFRLAICSVLAASVALPVLDLGDNPTLARPAVERDRYGIDKNRYLRQRHTIVPRETLSSIFGDFAVPPELTGRVGAQAKPVFDVGKVRAGNELFAYLDSTQGSYPIFVYAVEPSRYVVFDFRDSVAVYEGKLKPSVLTRTTRGTITHSLYETLDALGASSELVVQMARIFAWQVDFYGLQEGDQFAVFYDEGRIDDVVTELTVRAARFRHKGQDYYAFGFPQDDGTLGYYDPEGNALGREFLRAPVEYTRISSRYSRRRFHPVQKRYKPHLGTDFAAPHGTPIMATANGVVTAAAYAGDNGRYVRIRHNDIYETGYLHMSRIAVRRGQRVTQGQVIGYVGRTGLATGPHVCYRFWARGRQVDPLLLTLPPTASVDAADLDAFATTRNQYVSELTLPPHATD